MDEKERALALHTEIESVRNLRPKAFELVTDPEANLKERWTAFDELYEAIKEGLAKRGHSVDDVLTAVIAPSPQQQPITESQIERGKRVRVALAMLTTKYGMTNESITGVMMEADALVPAEPDHETGKPLWTMRDQALLGEFTALVRTELPEDWATFFRATSETAAKRKLAFRRIYALVGKAWLTHSLAPQAMTPEERQKIIIFCMMCHVPGDQWSDEDLIQLHADLLPIEEPDWASFDE